MRISDTEVKKALQGLQVSDTESVDRAEADVLGIESEAEAMEREAHLIKSVTLSVLNMPDREEMIASLKARIEAGEYNPSSEDIVDTMIRRAIADKMR